MLVVSLYLYIYKTKVQVILYSLVSENMMLVKDRNTYDLHNTGELKDYANEVLAGISENE